MDNQQMNSTSEQKNESSEFITKLIDMMQNYSDIIGWSDDGTQIMIRDLRKATQMVLPKYFRHSRFQSFVRQLNMYNFHKVCRQKNNTVNFKNDFFFRGNEANFPKIKRKKKINTSTKLPDLLQENIRWIEESSHLDSQTKALLIALFNFKHSCYHEVKRLTGMVMKVAGELKGAKLRRAEPHINEIRGVMEEMEERSEEVEGMMRGMKVLVKVTEEEVEKQVDIAAFQQSINSYLENTPITSTILEPYKVKKIEVDNFKQFKLHSFRSITSFIDVCREVSSAKEEDKQSNFSLELNQRQDQ